jgi:hypothetical protein
VHRFGSVLKNDGGSAEVFTSSSLVSYVSAPWGGGGDAPGTLPTTDVGDGHHAQGAIDTDMAQSHALVC